MTVPTISSWRLPRWMTGDLLVLAGLFVLALALWGPFGFDIPFSADSWWMENTVDNGIWMSPSVRPLVPVPFAIAARLSPTNLFIGENVLLFLMLFGKAWLLYLILKRLLKHRAFAFAAASLLLTFPADHMIFNLGTVNINFALFFFILAVYALIAYWQDRRWYFLPLMWFGLGVTTGLYEAVYPLLICTPLLLVWQEKRISRRVMIVSLLWYAVPLVVAGILLYVATHVGHSFEYETVIFRGFDLPQLVPTFLRVYRIHFVDGWLRPLLYSRPKFVIGAAALVAVICWGVFRQMPRLGWKTLLLLALGGLAMIGLGYAPYYPTVLRNAVDRTFFYSSVGAVITLAAVFLAVAQWLPIKRVIYAGLVAVFVGVGLTQLLSQHASYANQGAQELPQLRAILTQAPFIKPNTMLVVFDDSTDHSFGSIFASISYYLEESLQLISQNKRVSAAICYPYDETTWGTNRERCYIEADQVRVTWGDNLYRQKDYANIVAFRYHTDGTLTLETSTPPELPAGVAYAPLQLIGRYAPLPPRALTMLGMGSENSP